MINLRDLSNSIEIDLNQVNDNKKMIELGADSLKLMLLVSYIEENTCFVGRRYLLYTCKRRKRHVAKQMEQIR